MNVTSKQQAPAPGAGSRLRRRAVLAGGFVSAVGLVLTVNVAAHADEDWYDPAALETSCTQWVDGLGQADGCTFEPWTKENFTADVTRASGDTVNCTDVNATKSITWSKATSEENSIAVAVGVEDKLSEIFSISITTTYGHSWTKTTTESSTETAPVPAHSVAWIERGTPMQRVTGRMVHNYPKRRHGHFVWYTYPTLTNADPQALGYDTTIFRTRPITAAEQSALCGGAAVATTQDTDSVAGSKLAVTPTSTTLRQAEKPSTVTTVPNGDTSIQSAD